MMDFNGDQNNVTGNIQPGISVETQPVIPETSAVVQESVAQEFQQVQETSPVNQVPTMSVQTAPAAPLPPKKSKVPIIIGIVGALLAVILAVVLVLVLGDNKDDKKPGEDTTKETEQVDDNAQSDENDEDDDKDNKDKDNNDKDDKDDSGKVEDDKDTSSGDDSTNKDDTPVDAVVNAPYSGYLDSFTGMFAGDLSGIGDVFPNAMWNMIRFALADELGYMPSKDEAIEIMFEEVFAGAENEDVFVDKAEYTIISQDDVDSATIEKLQEGLCDYMVFDEIEEAYKVTFRIYMENDGESATAEDTAYAVYVDGEWTFMSVNYDLYMVDCTVEQVVDGLLGENFI